MPAPAHLNLTTGLWLCAAVLLAACGTDATTTPGPTGNTADSGSSSGADATAVDTATTNDASADTSGTDGAGLDAADAANPDASSADTADDAGADSENADISDTINTADTADTAQPDTAQPDTAPPVDAGPVDLDKYTEHSAKCTADADCAIPCGSGQCSQGKCSFNTFANTCLVDLGGDKVGCYGHGMKGQTADCLACNTTVSQSALTSVASLLPIDDDTHGIKTEDLSSGGMLWTLSAKRSVSGGTSLYFGNPTTHVYANDKHVKGSATTPELDVPKFAGTKPQLSFWLWLATEETKGFDFLQVDVVSGGKTTQVWHSDSIGGSTHGVWRNVEVPLDAWQGGKVQLRFTFDSVDADINAYEGAYIDTLTIRTGCCGSVQDCDDGNACTADTCAPDATTKNPVCSHTGAKTCCNTSADCDDGKPCTLDICSPGKGGTGGTCSHNDKPGCCMVQADCDDKDSCTIDQCPKAGAQCQHSNTCCKADSECTSNDPCLQGTCSAGECTFKSSCCIQDAECDDFNNCTLDACNDVGKCEYTASKAPGCCAPVPWANEFETDIKGWTIEAAKNGLLWEHATYPEGKLKDGKGAMKFGLQGKNELGDFKTYGYGNADSEPIQLQAGLDATLEISVTGDLKAQTGTPSSSNRIYVYVLDYADKAALLGYVYFNKTGDETVSFDISPAAGSTFKIRLRGYIYGYSSNPISGSGLLVDSVRIKTSCGPKTCTNTAACASKFYCRAGTCVDGICQFVDGCCTSAADCKSPNACAQATCSGSKCYFTEKKGCCNGDADCDDGNACTIDQCPAPGAQCKHANKAACCLSSSECDDSDKCTLDECVLNKCKNTNLCCNKDAECSDGESKCTIDTCGADKFCQHKATGAKGCCEPDVFSHTFDSPDLKGFVLKNSVATSKGWQIWTNAYVSKSPKGALHYGDPSTGNYNFGKSNGTAVTKDIKLPLDTPSELTYSTWLDTESSTTFDKLIVSLIVDNTKKTLWHKANSATPPAFKSKAWQEHKHDLSAYKGKTVKIEFLFDTNDGVSNSGKGVFIDDLKLTTKCP